MNPTDHVMQFFSRKEPTAQLPAIQDDYRRLATIMSRVLPEGPEKTVALRKLLEAKEATTRAALVDQPGERPASGGEGYVAEDLPDELGTPEQRGEKDVVMVDDRTVPTRATKNLRMLREDLLTVLQGRLVEQPWGDSVLQAALTLIATRIQDWLQQEAWLEMQIEQAKHEWQLEGGRVEPLGGPS